jgi:hypothetical protein
VIGPSFSTRKFSFVLPGAIRVALLRRGARTQLSTRLARQRSILNNRSFTYFDAERWPSGRRHQIANLAYWVTGTEGSNPSLSASQSASYAFSAGNSKIMRMFVIFFDLRAPEKLRFGLQQLI